MGGSSNGNGAIGLVAGAGVLGTGSGAESNLDRGGKNSSTSDPEHKA